MKSSKQFCFFASEPDLCHSCPYSPPPRMFAMQKTAPKCLESTIRLTLNDGVILMLNPPYPYSKHGWDPSIGIFFLATMNIGIFVPSLLGTKTWKWKTPINKLKLWSYIQTWQSREIGSTKLKRNHIIAFGEKDPLTMCFFFPIFGWGEGGQMFN